MAPRQPLERDLPAAIQGKGIDGTVELVTHRLRHGDLPALGAGGDPCRDHHRATEQIVALAHGLSGVQAHPHGESLVCRLRAVEDEGALEVDRTGHA